MKLIGREVKFVMQLIVEENCEVVYSDELTLNACLDERPSFLEHRFLFPFFQR